MLKKTPHFFLFFGRILTIHGLTAVQSVNRISSPTVSPATPSRWRSVVRCKPLVQHDRCSVLLIATGHTWQVRTCLLLREASDLNLLSLQGGRLAALHAAASRATSGILRPEDPPSGLLKSRKHSREGSPAGKWVWDCLWLEFHV